MDEEGGEGSVVRFAHTRDKRPGVAFALIRVFGLDFISSIVSYDLDGGPDVFDSKMETFCVSRAKRTRARAEITAAPTWLSFSLNVFILLSSRKGGRDSNRLRGNMPSGSVRNGGKKLSRCLKHDYCTSCASCHVKFLYPVGSASHVRTLPCCAYFRVPCLFWHVKLSSQVKSSQAS